MALSLIMPLMAGLFVFQLAVFVAALVDGWRLPVPATGLPPLLRSGGAAALAVAIGVLVLQLTTASFRAYYLQAYRLPAGSMIPALLVGDRFLVDKFVYRHRDPARGDVVVFEYPVDEERDFIKRVVGLPGETIHLRGRHIFVNCTPTSPSCQPIKDPWGYYEDRLGMGDHVGKWEIPAGSYFVMGDNRNNSQDSRFWGFVKREKIRGRAFLIYWSSDSGSVRWARLGKRIS
jgi:signal peptidase I